MRSVLCAVAVLMLAGSAHANEARIHATVALKARARYPQSRNFTHADNFKKDRYLGGYAVVVSAGQAKPGCTGKVMGVGFGRDEKDAHKDATRLMGMIFPFNDGKVKVEHSKAY